MLDQPHVVRIEGADVAAEEIDRPDLCPRGSELDSELSLFVGPAGTEVIGDAVLHSAVVVSGVILFPVGTKTVDRAIQMGGAETVMYSVT
jgi:hypothetical protein